MIAKRRFGLALWFVGAGLIASTLPASADKISHPKAVFSGLDKITGRIISFEVATNETVQFGSLQITERACYTRPPTEAPQTVSFAQVDEIDAKKKYKQIFSGWMFAASPGLNGIEHPVYDIWLTDCKGGTAVIKSPDAAEAAVGSDQPANTDQGKTNAAKTGSPKTDAQIKADAQAKADSQAKSDQQSKIDQAKADRKRRRAEAAARLRQTEQDDEQNPDLPPADVPQQEPRRAPPSRSFYPDASDGRDPGGLY